jgi:Protochlamydia outer membrane protein
MKFLVALLFCARLSAYFCFDVDGEVGYRRDHLRWSISGGGADILSELTYRNLDTIEARGLAEARLLCWLVRLRGATGYLFSGTDQDDDFRFSGRQDQFGYSTSRLRGMTNDVAFDIGRCRSLGPLALIVRWGVAWDHIYLNAFDGFNRLIDPPRSFGDRVDSTYHMHWVTSYNSLELRLALPANRLRLEGALHYGAFIGRGNWRLRDFHFDQVAPAFGLALQGSWRHHLCGPLWTVACLGGSYWTTSGYGFHDGDRRLRRARWSSIHTSLGLALTV